MIGRALCLALALLTSACVQQPALPDSGQFALLRTWGEFIEINGTAPEAPYQVALEAGSHSATVRYRTLRVDYDCLFEFTVKPGQVYEIIDQSNPSPLRLYRWKRQNGLWANRVDPVDPLSCSES